MGYYQDLKRMKISMNRDGMSSGTDLVGKKREKKAKVQKSVYNMLHFL